MSLTHLVTLWHLLEAYLSHTVGQQGVEAQPWDVCNLRVARLCRFRCAHAKFVYEPPARFDTAVRSYNHPEPEYLVEVEAPFRVSTSRASGTVATRDCRSLQNLGKDHPVSVSLF